MQPPADGVGGAAERDQIATLEQRQALGRRKAMAGDGAVENGGKRDRHGGTSKAGR
jgi:hypothetical protein